MTATAVKITDPETFQTRLASFQDKVEGAVLMANALSHELGYVNDQVRESLAGSDVPGIEKARETLSKLTEQLQEIASYTDVAEVEIEKFVSDVQSV